MRISILTPTVLPATSGNAVAADRIATGLRAAGDEVEVLGLSGDDDSSDILTRLAMFDPAIVHLFDAHAAGEVLGDPVPGHPYVLAMSGDDLHIQIFDPTKTAAIQRVMHAARAIVLPSEAEAEVARQTMPALAEKVHVVPMAASGGEASFQLRRELEIPMSAFVFMLPGAVRSTKNQGIAIAALDSVIEEHPNVHLVLAGQLVEGDAYGAAILEAVRARPWCHHIESIPHEAMGAAYSDADVVLNTSLAEAGSNVVIEAQAAGRALIVSAIPGNLGLVKTGETALVYSDQQSLSDASRQLIRDASLRQRLGAAGHQAVSSRHQAATEIQALRELYAQISPA